jgi:coenzyme F420 hydrogenase subunit beta
LVVARTARGKAFVDGAVAAGYLTLTPAEAWKIERSQQGLLAKKGAVWGRRLALRCLGLPVTELHGLDLRPSWKTLTFSEKVKATLGTVRRVMTRGLRRPLVLDKSTRTVVKPVLVVPPAAP